MELQVQKREVFGKKLKGLRKKGFIPAELYGRGVENLHLAVPLADFRRVYKEAGENQIVNVVVDGEARPTIIHDVHFDAIKDEPLNIDFYQVNMDEEIEAKVPIELVGEAPGVKAGGILVKALNEMPVESLPGDMPSKFTVDISGLDAIGKSIHVKDIKIGDKVKLRLDPNMVVVTIAEPEKEEEIPAEAPSVETVVVEGEEKKAERDAAKASQEATEGGPAKSQGGAKKQANA
ncbi:MAG: 50S ribosomal protein L25 [Candidatus Colwellbacteria bacterium]|nr:50S ribosomal protein L25 [Candidatus Colwellbacteria bacterium]